MSETRSAAEGSATSRGGAGADAMLAGQRSWLDEPGHRSWLHQGFADVITFALRSILPEGGFAYQAADGSPMPGLSPPALPHRPRRLHRRPGGAPRRAGLGRAARPRDGFAHRAARRPRARGLAQRARRGHPQDDLRPRARRPGRGRCPDRGPPRRSPVARAGRRRHRHPALGPAGPGAARVVRSGLVRLRGLPRRQRQHARARGVHRDGARHRGCRVAPARPGDRRPAHQRRCARARLAAAGALHGRLGGAPRLQPRRAAAPVPPLRCDLRALPGVVALPAPARRVAARRLAGLARRGGRRPDPPRARRRVGARRPARPRLHRRLGRRPRGRRAPALARVRGHPDHGGAAAPDRRPALGALVPPALDHAARWFIDERGTCAQRLDDDMQQGSKVWPGRPDVYHCGGALTGPLDA